MTRASEGVVPAPDGSHHVEPVEAPEASEKPTRTPGPANPMPDAPHFPAPGEPAAARVPGPARQGGEQGYRFGDPLAGKLETMDEEHPDPVPEEKD
jgi:hypothetical protein